MLLYQALRKVLKQGKMRTEEHISSGCVTGITSASAFDIHKKQINKSTTQNTRHFHISSNTVKCISGQL